MPKPNSRHHVQETIEGRFEQLIFSPGGQIEGALLSVAKSPVQIAVEPWQSDSYAGLERARKGQKVVVRAMVQGPSKHGESEHPIYDLVELVSINGAAPRAKPDDAGSGYKGKVVRFNYARHGEPNGVVLDTGDFIHMRPGGFALFGLAVGDAVEAEGDAQRLVTDDGWAVEATVVNGYMFE